MVGYFVDKIMTLSLYGACCPLDEWRAMAHGDAPQGNFAPWVVRSSSMTKAWRSWTKWSCCVLINLAYCWVDQDPRGNLELPSGRSSYNFHGNTHG